MKKILLLFLPVGLLCCSMRSDDCITKDGYFRGKRLFGRVKVVESFPDFKVKVVSSFPDLKVKIVNSFPDDPGEWQFVESSPDIKIQFVESFPDFTIKFVESFPGVEKPCK